MPEDTTICVGRGTARLTFLLDDGALLPGILPGGIQSPFLQFNA